MENKQNQQEEFDGYTSKPYDLNQITGGGVNPAIVGPLFGVPTEMKGPEYLEYNIMGRSAYDRFSYNVGVTYLFGIIAGGSYGFVEGLRTAPSTKFNLRLNSVLNKCGKRGSRLGNALGSLALLYSTIETMVEFGGWYSGVRVERYLGEWAYPMLTAATTGAIYKSTMGPKTMAVAAGLGAGMAGTAFLIKTFLPPRPTSSKTILFF